mmetsp:Transcript_51919/g.150857  ORF Transcript_51919/g.150857 Transcript_51919/m.150857 type:complete len:139 (-) Transcript_51919:44-460(-)
MAPWTKQQRSRLMRELEAQRLVDVGAKRKGYEVFASAFDDFDALLAKANETPGERDFDGIPKAEVLKMLWVAEQATNPGKQPSIVRLPSGLNITRQSSGVGILRSVSAKWEDRALGVITRVRDRSSSCCGGCLAGFRR